MTYEEKQRAIRLTIIELQSKHKKMINTAEKIDRNIEYLRAVKAKFDFEPEFMFI